MESKPAAVVFPSRATGGGDKQALQRIHDRNLERINELWEHVRELEDQCAHPNQGDEAKLHEVLDRETSQLQALVRDHAISPAFDEATNQLEREAEIESVGTDPAAPSAGEQAAVVPMTAAECKDVATEAYGAIGPFMDSHSFVTTGFEVLGWTDRRQVEGNDVKFMLCKTFRGFTPAEVLDRAWRVMTSPRGMRRMYSQSMQMLIKRLQVVDDDNVILYRVITSVDGRAQAKSLFLASRFQVGDKFILMYRSIDPKRLLPVAGKTDTPIAETWMNIFSWNVFEAAGSKGENTKFACGGIVPGTATTSAQEWMLEVLLLALRWEAKVVGAEGSIK